MARRSCSWLPLPCPGCRLPLAVDCLPLASLILQARLWHLPSSGGEHRSGLGLHLLHSGMRRPGCCSPDQPSSHADRTAGCTADRPPQLHRAAPHSGLFPAGGCATGAPQGKLELRMARQGFAEGGVDTAKCTAACAHPLLTQYCVHAMPFCRLTCCPATQQLQRRAWQALQLTLAVRRVVQQQRRRSQQQQQPGPQRGPAAAQQHPLS